MKMSDAWKADAYPLQLITIRLQGTRHCRPSTILHWLDEVRARVLAGEKSGELSDDDDGYHFDVIVPDESILPGPASSR